MRKTLLTAHSGCDGTPDNSGAFLEYAMALGADCVEVDVRRAADGQLVLSHDEGSAQALLSDALALLRRHPEKKLNCDLKQQNLEISVWALARESGVGGQIAFSGEVSALAAQSEPGMFETVEWYVNIEGLFPEVEEPGFQESLTQLRASGMADRLELFLWEYNARCVNAHYLIRGTRLYPELMRRKIPLSVWTPGDERIILNFMQDGAYNVTTRNAGRACQLREAFLTVGGVR